MNSSDSPADEYQLGPIYIKGKENTLVTAEGAIVLLPKVMSLLLYLCRHSQQVVSFDELSAAIWPREVVGDNAIYNLVGQLRKALGDKASHPTYIQTVSKVGYRLLINAEPVSAAAVLRKPAENKTAMEAGVAQTKSKQLKWPLTVLVAVSLLFIATRFLFLQKPEEVRSPDSQRQMKLAYYQLYRGDPEGLDQAIDTLQKVIVTEPSWAKPKVELAYAFIRKAGIAADNKPVWINKGRAISSDNNLGDMGNRLAAIVSAIDNNTRDSGELQTLFSEGDVLTSARLAYSDILFEKGKTDLAARQIRLVLDRCMDCPYVYRKFATAQIVLGNVQEGFEAFSQYRMLVNRMSNHPAEITGFVPLNLQTLKTMAHWQVQTPLPEKLQAHQRNNLALFYLTLGHIDKAKETVKSTPETATQFFDLYTQAAIAGAKGDFEISYALLKKRQMNYPDHERFRLSVIYALWQLGRFDEAMQTIRQYQLLEVAESLTPDSLPEVMPFPIWSLYADLLIHSDNPSLGEHILNRLEKRLKAGTLPGSHKADIRLASILALQGKHQEALKQLEMAIDQGWVSDFNLNWWYLQDSPYFRNLKSNAEFQRIVAKYHATMAREFGSLPIK